MVVTAAVFSTYHMECRSTLSRTRNKTNNRVSSRGWFPFPSEPGDFHVSQAKPKNAEVQLVPRDQHDTRQVDTTPTKPHLRQFVPTCDVDVDVARHFELHWRMARSLHVDLYVGQRVDPPVEQIACMQAAPLRRLDSSDTPTSCQSHLFEPNRTNRTVNHWHAKLVKLVGLACETIHFVLAGPSFDFLSLSQHQQTSFLVPTETECETGQTALSIDFTWKIPDKNAHCASNHRVFTHWLRLKKNPQLVVGSLPVPSPTSGLCAQP